VKLLDQWADSFLVGACVCWKC